MRRREKRIPIVHVSWIDAHMDAAATEATVAWIERQGPKPMDAVGYLTAKTRKAVVVSQSRRIDDDDPGQYIYRDHLVIPAQNVRRIRRLK